MRNMMRERSSTICCNKLNEADFENIWLRVKDRSFKLLLAGSVAIGLGGFGAGYYMAKHAVDSQVERFLSNYMKGETFKAQVSSSLITGTSELQAERLAAEKTLKELNLRAASLEHPGVTISDKEISLTSADGRSFHIERGTLMHGASQEINFTHPFSKPPIVFVDADFASVGYERRQVLSDAMNYPGMKRVSAQFMIIPSTETGFEIKARLVNAVSWVAIGW